MIKEKLRIVLLALVFLFSTGMVIRQLNQYQKIVDENDEAMQIAHLKKDPKMQHPAATTAPEETQSEEPVDPAQAAAADLANVDLEALRAANEDVLGWIAIGAFTLSLKNAISMRSSIPRITAARRNGISVCSSAPTVFRKTAIRSSLTEATFYRALPSRRSATILRKTPAILPRS